jgi:hypothetical protein
MVLDVIFVGGFESGGLAIMAGARLRLLHAAMRHLFREEIRAGRFEWDEERDGLIISREDMLATLMGFSIVTVDGLPRLGVPLERDDMEAIWMLWRNFGRAMGIPKQDMPEDVNDARAFYQAYMRRHFKRAEENEAGVKLTKMHLDVMADQLYPLLYPQPDTRKPGKALDTSEARDVCRGVMIHLIGPKCTRMLGLDGSDLRGMRAWLRLGQAMLGGLYYAYTRLTRRWSGHRQRMRRRARALNRLLLLGLLTNELGGRPKWVLPRRLAGLASEHDDDHGRGNRRGRRGGGYGALGARSG